jgi:hypothetical protein
MVFTLIAFFVFLVIIGPIFSIMALNTLFNVGIDLSIGTWLAMAWLHFVAGSGILGKR